MGKEKAATKKAAAKKPAAPKKAAAKKAAQPVWVAELLARLLAQDAKLDAIQKAVAVMAVKLDGIPEALVELPGVIDGQREVTQALKDSIELIVVAERAPQGLVAEPLSDDDVAVASDATDAVYAATDADADQAAS